VTLTETKRALDEIGSAPTKSLGQNFLIDQNILRIVVEAAEIVRNEPVLEIGAGLGVLTQALLEAGATVTAVEKDVRLHGFLQRRFAGRKNVKLIQGDALTLDLERAPSDFKLIANLPYSISTAILRRFVDSPVPPRRMVLMLQREVGARLAAAPGSRDYSVLTVCTQVKYRVTIRHVVSRRCFYPAPEVDSAIVVLEYRPHPRWKEADAGLFNGIVHAGFGQRRKQFAKLLRKAGFTAEQVESGFATLGLPAGVRAEALSVEQLLQLTKELSDGRNV